MAKRTTKKAAPRKKSTMTKSERSPKELFFEIISNPTVQYVASGIAMAALTKLASKISGKYPEISNFITENLDTVEGKLGEFRGGSSNEVSPRH